MIETFSNIEKLKKLVWQGTPKYKFNTRKDISEIETFEKAYELTFPESYKQFLERFNGGMILEFRESFYIDMTEWEPDGPKKSSFYLFGLEDVNNAYRDAKLDDWLLHKTVAGIYPIIPICHTPDDNLLFMINGKGLKEESPIFSSVYHEGKYTCTKIARDFNTFLGYYIAMDGFPALLPDDTEPSWEVYMKNNEVLKIANTRETNTEIIARSTASLEIIPDEAWTYCERGNAYLYNKQIKLALADFNKAIELDEKEEFFYHCRGDLILEYGDPRKALIDLDIAVNLDPDNKMFRIRRADAFLKLNKLNKALADCNFVLKMDPKFELGLHTRIEAYNALGETEKSKIDSDLLDEIIE